MASFDQRKDEIVNKYLVDVIEQKVARLVNDQQMIDSVTNWHRGYVAACRDFAAFYHDELQKKLSEG